MIVIVIVNCDYDCDCDCELWLWLRGCECECDCDYDCTGGLYRAWWWSMCCRWEGCVCGGEGDGEVQDSASNRRGLHHWHCGEDVAH